MINDKGETVIPFIYESIHEYWGDLVIVERAQKKGIYHLDGHMVCPAKFNLILPFSEFVFGVCQNHRLGFMNLNGEIVIPMEYIYDESNYNIFRDGCCCVLKEKENMDLSITIIIL